MASYSRCSREVLEEGEGEGREGREEATKGKGGENREERSNAGLPHSIVSVLGDSHF